MKKCCTAECGNVIPPGSKLDACPTCRGSFYYWRRKRPAQLLERRRNLAKYSDRIDQMLGNKVSVMPRRKHA